MKNPTIPVSTQALASRIALVPLLTSLLLGFSSAESFGGVELPPIQDSGKIDQGQGFAGRGEARNAEARERREIPVPDTKANRDPRSNGGGDAAGHLSVTEGLSDETRKKSGINLQETGRMGKAVIDKKGARTESYMESVIWADTFYMITNAQAWIPYNQEGKADGIKMASPATDYEKMIALYEKKEKSLREEAEKKSNKIPAYYAGGYCSVANTVYVSKSNEFASLDCMLNFGEAGFREVNVFLGLYPDYKREILIGLPVYVTFSNGKRASFDGVVLNSKKTSINVASWVDNRKIERLLSESALSLNDIAYKYAVSYMGALQASKTQEKLDYVYVSDGNGTNTGLVQPVRTTTTQKPDPADYLISAGIEFLTGIISTIGRNYMEDTGPLYRLDRGARLYVEGVISFDEKGLSKKFGLIEQLEQKKADKNNQEWRNDNRKIIQRYQRGNGASGQMLQTLGGH